MKRNDFQYAINVWATGLLLPAVLFLLTALIRGRNYDVVLIAILSVMFGGLFSLPSLFVLFWATVRVNNLENRMITKKVKLVFISLLLTYLPFFLLEIFWGSGMLHAFSSVAGYLTNPVFLAYWLSICLGLIVFKLNPVGAQQT